MDISEVMHDFSRHMTQARCRWTMATTSGSEKDWNAVLQEQGFWTVTHNDLCSIVAMDEEALRQSIVEDMLTTLNGKTNGAFGVYPFEQLERFIPQNMISRVLHALTDVIDMGLVTYEDGTLFITPGREHDAMEYAGVYYDFSAEATHDVVDTLLMAGGVELLAEELTDLAHKVNIKD